jgi:putative CocE/NonD family hydrolase
MSERRTDDAHLVRTDLPRSHRVIENAWIPLSDGFRLAARIWLPEDAEEDPVPALLEYIPYRKGDWTAVGDSTRHAYLAGHGYASLRVDIRGSGDSEGILRGKYLAQEQDDALEVLRWISKQPWSTGACGMFGISWGGYSALQVAARRPPELKAIISVCASDDRYADDVTYVGGAVLALHAISWGSMMLAFNARPPDPSVVGDGWRQAWLERMATSPAFAADALSHQRRDSFWRQGSVCEDYGAITCPVYAVGGWADCFRNGLFRLLEGLPGPRKGLVGPWGHQYPETGVPGPRIGFLQEALRWWDHWLKGIDTGIMEEPLLRVWMPDPVEPQTSYPLRPGRWVSEPEWPSPHVETQERVLEFPSDAVSSARVVGLEAGCWCGFGMTGDFAPDQRREDGLSLCATSAPLERELQVLGFPDVAITLAADRRQAVLAVRLCDVGPDGASFLVTRGVLNLTHRDGHETTAPLEPGTLTTVTVRLNAIAHTFPAGHRIRIALSPTYWPWVWPSPEAVTVRVSRGSLFLPVRRTRAEVTLEPFREPEAAPALEHEDIGLPTAKREIRVDLASRRHVLRWDHDPLRGVRRTLGAGLEFETRGSDTYSIREGAPLSARARSRWALRLARGDWRIRVEATGVLTASKRFFRARTTLRAHEGEEEAFANTWIADIPRDEV